MIEFKVILFISVILNCVVLYTLGEIAKPLVEVLKNDAEIRKRLLEDMKNEKKC